VAGIAAGIATAQRAPIPTVAKDPYAGAIVVNAADGTVLFEDNADARAYPASMLKLMGLMILLDRVDHGGASLQDMIPVTAEAARMGGSQVYLKEGERFSLDEMLYALMIQSANDVALALAIHTAGSKEGFLALMNAHARRMGMASTEFHSVHGLPPAEGQKPDITTARDFARLCVEVVRRKDALRYTSATERGFRNGTFIMRTHNSLLKDVPGCDGLKTGYTKTAGYSIAATASRDGARAIAVILGSVSKEMRDRKAREWLERGLAAIPRAPPPPPAVAVAVAAPAVTVAASGTDAESPADEPEEKRRSVAPWVALALLALTSAVAWVLLSRRTPGGPSDGAARGETPGAAPKPRFRLTQNPGGGT
jgi:D-alanyl-D-alanine carboxypeptidase (penicillin-binding protein 5/6)